MADQTPKSYHTDPNLYLYTSLTAGSSQIITATSRMETILKANKIKFQALDVATDEKARMLWGRRAGKRKLPGLVRMGMIVGDLEEVEEWNEYGELRDNVEPGSKPPSSAPVTPSKTPGAPSSDTMSTAPGMNPVTPSKPPAFISSTETPPRPTPSSTDSPLTTAMRQAGFEAAKKAGDARSKARVEALQASKAEADAPSSETLQKLDHSGPTGMPPPSGTTEAGEASKAETGNTSVQGNADHVPLTEEGKQETEKEGMKSNAHGLWTTESEEAKTRSKVKESPSSKEVEDSANRSIIADSSEDVLEGKGQGGPSTDEIPSSEEVDAAANAAILQDKSHIVLAGSGEPGGMRPSETVGEAAGSGDAEERGGSELKKATTVSDAGQELPGKKTQDQPAASAVEAGISVAD